MIGVTRHSGAPWAAGHSITFWPYLSASMDVKHIREDSRRRGVRILHVALPIYQSTQETSSTPRPGSVKVFDFGSGGLGDERTYDSGALPGKPGENDVREFGRSLRGLSEKFHRRANYVF
ncbi:hypothetical protein M7I_6570 [Glarea lozoyensis 74030]|uniref:Uncharacterized protein n=1 Tax=Glarea lozoyensis (strain ATCC 74030 / MF5533) TaxID=1104152 RepID=H0EUY0_GLAL7|nr:hypothetical protein M7I_6570 [Glarea lozoyensis 74030]